MVRVSLSGFVGFEFNCNTCGHNNEVRMSVESFGQLTEMESGHEDGDFFVNTTCENCHEHTEVSFVY